MEEPPAELAAYSGPWHRVPDTGPVRLTAINGTQIATTWALPGQYQSGGGRGWTAANAAHSQVSGRGG